MPLPWPAPCSILRIALPGWASCAPPGAAFRSTTCTSWPAMTILSLVLVLCRSCWPSGCRCSAKPAAWPPGACSTHLLRRPLFAPPNPRPRWEPGLRQVWLLLGGAACVDTTARANLNLLWSCLDSLPGGEQDLLGPGLDAASTSSPRCPTPRPAAIAACS